MHARSPQVAIAGAGIAGLTAALAFTRRGFHVRLIERTAQIEEVGAGLQISPNATRILDRLGVLALLSPAAVQPQALALRNAGSLRELAVLPLGQATQARWGAAYLTAHRADLQSALLAAARQQPGITIETGAMVREAAFRERGVALSIQHSDGRREELRCDLAVGADGVRSTMRQHCGRKRQSRYSGFLAWRAMLRHDGGDLLPAETVCAYLQRKFHLVAYPVRAGAAVNLVAVTKAPETVGDVAMLEAAMKGAHGALRALVAQAAPWTTWPLHEVAQDGAWTHPAGIALIGDAAHAMTPFAAQGAAMAIEDAFLLAETVAASPDDLATALAAYERLRRGRVKRVAARGAFNRRAWHAWGPAALVRDRMLAARAPERLLADLDWLYGYDAEKAVGQ